MSPDTDLLHELIRLAAELGDQRQMAIAAEGNLSASLDASTFLVKASGTSLRHLRPEHLVQVGHGPLLAAVKERREVSDGAVEDLLLGARVDSGDLKPSVESLFHSVLLQFPGIRYVAHCHPIAVNQILCSPRAADFAEKRLFPDQVVCCGATSLLLPYVDPGLALARILSDEVEAFVSRHGAPPRLLLLENHGLIAVGEHPRTVSAAVSMAEKAAQIFLGAALLGGPVFMDTQEVRRIEGRSDEHYRRRMLQS